ncbi:MAG: hypothetical protein MHPSP_003334, partial [Paramarteilia canceri]
NLKNMDKILKNSSQDYISNKKPLEPLQEEDFSEIFNDIDFYRSLIRDASKYLDVDIQKSSRKKKIEQPSEETKTSAKKGVSYKVVDSLVGFMTPVKGEYWSDSKRDELFKNLAK